uniref:PNPLA domain-containing protein n=1 Tax=Cyclophora tenuis TaxID=216820 RepID=A0A7S1GNL0_CYCTE|mmetsp:Transcript_3878/g.6621  ORF Transcript_3878/g.6621 Transcript_3878/m.6621 type:complete len:211 (+) Transcript_3878:113-745(+)
MTGASAGAVAAACEATEVDFEEFVKNVIEQCETIRLWARPLGLVGVLGSITERVLESMLPPDSHHRMKQRHASVLIQPANFLRESIQRVSSFRSKKSLISALTASSHIPFLVNGRARAVFEGKAYIDGALFSSDDDFVDSRLDAPSLKIDFANDPAMMDKNLLDCVKTPSRDEIWQIYRTGYMFAKNMDRKDQFECLTPRLIPFQRAQTV